MQISINAPRLDNSAEWKNYLRSIWRNADNQQRKALSKKTVDYYQGEQLPYLEAELSRVFTDPNSRRHKRAWTHNITKQIVGALSQTYTTQVRRIIKDRVNKKTKELISKKLWGDLNRVLADAEANMVLEGMALIHAKYSERKGRMIYTTYHQYEYDLVFSGIDERELEAVILSDYMDLERATVRIYTKNNTYQYEGGKLVEQISHGYGFLPFVVAYREDPRFEDYIMPDENLCHANLEINLLISNLLQIAQRQAHGVMIMKIPHDLGVPHTTDASPSHPDGGAAMETDHRLDIHDSDKSIVTMQYGIGGDEPKVETLNWEADYDGLIKSIGFAMTALGRSYGVNVGDTELSLSVQPQTATSIYVSEQKRRKLLERYSVIFGDVEKELFKISYEQLKYVDPKIPEELEIDIEYLDNHSLLEGISVDQIIKLQEGGIITRIEVLAALYPGLSDQDLVELAKEMDRRKLELQPEEIDPEPDLKLESDEDPEME